MRLIATLQKNLLTPPYRLLPWAVFALVLLNAVFQPHSPLRSGSLADPDDYMRLNQVTAWLQGQSWYDLSHPRLSPGAHTIVHWSRLVDLPIAFVMLPLIPLFGMKQAALIASFIVPPFIFILLLKLVTTLARILLGKGRANLVVALIPFTSVLLFDFSPGRVDHHGWQTLIAGFGFASLLVMLLCRGGWRWGILAGMTFAAGLWITPDIVPCLLLTLASLALFASLRGGFVLRNAAVFGASLALATTLVLPAALPIAAWNDLTISWFSTGYVIFAALAGSVLVLAWLLGRNLPQRWLRLGVMAGLGLLAAVAFLYLVPQAQRGPFADYDPFNATTAIDNIMETRPLIWSLRINPYNPWSFVNALYGYFYHIFPGLAAFAVCLYAAWHAQSRKRMIWMIYALFLISMLVAALFLQFRMMRFEQVFQLPVLAWVVWGAWDRFRNRWSLWTRYRAAVLAFLLVGPLPIAIAPPLFNALIRANKTATSCNLKPAAEFLAERYSGAHTLMAGMNEGSELLFRTPLNVIGANYNVPGNPDVLAFFSARDDAQAQAALRKWKADLVLTCRSVPPLLAQMDKPQFGKTAFLREFSGGTLRIVSHPDNRLTLVERLVNGDIPLWLKPVEIPASKDYLLFEVRD